MALYVIFYGLFLGVLVVLSNIICIMMVNGSSDGSRGSMGACTVHALKDIVLSQL